VVEMGADEVQGYLVGRPSSTPRTNFAEHLDERRKTYDGRLSYLIGS
jgi:hypothetical protein